MNKNEFRRAIETVTASILIFYGIFKIIYVSRFNDNVFYGFCLGYGICMMINILSTQKVMKIKKNSVLYHLNKYIKKYIN